MYQISGIPCRMLHNCSHLQTSLYLSCRTITYPETVWIRYDMTEQWGQVGSELTNPDTLQGRCINISPRLAGRVQPVCNITCAWHSIKRVVGSEGMGQGHRMTRDAVQHQCFLLRLHVPFRLFTLSCTRRTQQQTGQDTYPFTDGQSPKCLLVNSAKMDIDIH